MKRPEFLSHTQLTGFREEFGITDDVFLVGIRGALKLASPDVNDRGIYDDAIYLINLLIPKTFNANVDPSRYAPGMAYLIPGVYEYRVGVHGLSKPKEKQYKALVQSKPVTIKRDGGIEETGWFGINIHKGGYSTTGSEGCQTIHPDQWIEFMNDVTVAMAAFHMKTIKYLLVDQT